MLQAKYIANYLDILFLRMCTIQYGVHFAGDSSRMLESHHINPALIDLKFNQESNIELVAALRAGPRFRCRYFNPASSVKPPTLLPTSCPSTHFPRLIAFKMTTDRDVNQVALTILSLEHFDAVKRAIFNITATSSALETFSQVVNSLPVPRSWNK